MTYQHLRLNRHFLTFALLAALGLSAAHASAAVCTGVNAWNSSSTYSAGNKATQAGSLFEAKWSTQNQSPSLSGEWDVWKNLGSCESASTGGLELILREATRSFTLAAGEENYVASACLTGETVVSGGATGIPAGPVIMYSSPTFDGNRSGWIVQYKNATASAITISASTAALCTKGKITLGQ